MATAMSFANLSPADERGARVGCGAPLDGYESAVSDGVPRSAASVRRDAQSFQKVLALLPPHPTEVLIEKRVTP